MNFCCPWSFHLDSQWGFYLAMMMSLEQPKQKSRVMRSSTRKREGKYRGHLWRERILADSREFPNLWPSISQMAVDTTISRVSAVLDLLRAVAMNVPVENGTGGPSTSQMLN